MITDNITQTKKNTARVKDKCSILLGEGDMSQQKKKKKKRKIKPYNIIIIIHQEADDLTEISLLEDQS